MQPRQWPGQLSDGVVPADLVVLARSTPPFTVAELEPMIEEVFAFHDDSPPMFLKAGSLRQGVRWAFAHIIMYYPARYTANEMLNVCAALRAAFDATINKAGVLNAHATLLSWGKELQSQFVADNLHLTMRASHPPMEQITGALQNMTTIMMNLQSAITTLAVRVEGCESVLKTLVSGAAADHVSHLATPLSRRSQPGTPAAALRTALVEAEADTAAATASPTAGAVAPTAASVRNAFDQLSCPKGSPDLTISLNKLLATTFFVKCVERGLNIPPLASGDETRGRDVLAYFVGMAVPHEMQQLEAKRGAQAIAMRLCKLLTLYFRNIYKEKGLNVPSLKVESFYVNSFSEQKKCAHCSLALTISALRPVYAPSSCTLLFCAILLTPSCPPSCTLLFCRKLKKEAGFAIVPERMLLQAFRKTQLESLGGGLLSEQPARKGAQTVATGQGDSSSNGTVTASQGEGSGSSRVSPRARVAKRVRDE